MNIMQNVEEFAIYYAALNKSNQEFSIKLSEYGSKVQEKVRNTKEELQKDLNATILKINAVKGIDTRLLKKTNRKHQLFIEEQFSEIRSKYIEYVKIENDLDYFQEQLKLLNLQELNYQEVDQKRKEDEKKLLVSLKQDLEIHFLNNQF